MAENLCTILCCLHTFHKKKKKKRWSRQTTIDHLKFVKGAKKIFGSPKSDILESWPKTKLKKSSFKKIQKNNSKLENLKIVKYLFCTICFQIDTQCIRYCLLHTMLQSTSTWQTSIDDSSFGGGGVAYSVGWIYCWNLQDEWPTWAQFAVNIINHIGHRVIQKHLLVVMVMVL